MSLTSSGVQHAIAPSSTQAISKRPISENRASEVSPFTNAGRQVILSDESRALAQSSSAYAMDTGAGKKHLDLETHFLPHAAAEAHTLDDLSGLLMPSSNNIQALSEHISSVFPDFLKSHGIPDAPTKISYDNIGQIVLPSGYQYAHELKQALSENPAMGNELRTVNALSSHLAALQELEPFHHEFAQAKSDADRALIIQKYSHLLSNNRTYPEVSLTFSEGGALTVTAGGKALA